MHRLYHFRLKVLLYKEAQEDPQDSFYKEAQEEVQDRGRTLRLIDQRHKDPILLHHHHSQQLIVIGTHSIAKRSRIFVITGIALHSKERVYDRDDSSQEAGVDRPSECRSALFGENRHDTLGHPLVVLVPMPSLANQCTASLHSCASYTK
jgi:hypothetical protein